MALLAITSSPAFGAVPICVLGGPTAVNPNRQLGPGESFVITDRPLVVNLQFKPTKEHPEQVGECMLPAGSKVAEKDGIMIWAATCGNDEVNRNIVVTTDVKPALAPPTPQTPAPQTGTVQPACPASGCSSSSATVNLFMIEQTRQQEEQPRYEQSSYFVAPPPVNHHWGIITGVVVTAVVLGVVFGLHHGSTTSGNVNTGGVQ